MNKRKTVDILTGNIIRDPDGKSLWIVTGVNDYPEGKGTISFVAFDSENVSGVMRLDDHERIDACGNCEGMDNDCECCHGTNSVTKKVKGWRRAKVMAPNAKEFFLGNFKKAFNLEV